MGIHANDAASAAGAVASEGGVKYRLVEAEEVDGAKQAQQQAQRGAGASKSKGAWQPLSSPASNGNLNWSQSPHDGEVAVEKPSNDSCSSSNNDYRSTSRPTRGRGRGGRVGGGGRGSGGGRGPRRFAPQHDSNGMYINGAYVPNTDPKLTAAWARGQIEFYFSPGNLVRDMFLRQHMDVDGYVPLAFVGSFQAVFAVHQDYPSLLEAVKHSETLELDEENEKIRPRNNWKQWLWPNGDGTLGVPRYIKLKDDDAIDASS